MFRISRLIIIAFIVTYATTIYAVERIPKSNCTVFKNYSQQTKKMWTEFAPINRIYMLGYLDKKYSKNINDMSQSTLEHIIMLYKTTSHISALCQLLDSTYDPKRKSYNDRALTIILDQLIFEKYFINNSNESYKMLKNIENVNYGMKELKKEILYQYHEELRNLTDEIDQNLNSLIMKIANAKNF